MLRDFFERVRKANLSLKPSKCKIGFSQVDFLGHTLIKNSICPQTDSVGRILKTGRPTTKKECWSLLGMINFYRRYIISKLLKWLRLYHNWRKTRCQMLKRGDKQEEAFTKIKQCLSSEPIFVITRFEPWIHSADRRVKSKFERLFATNARTVKHPIFYARKG